MTRHSRWFAAVALVATAAGPWAWTAAAAQQKVLKFIPQADLRILDPIATTAYITRNHGYMVYDTLFAMDEKFNVRAQMGKHDSRTGSYTSRCARAQVP